jgi:hypothetical protein
MDGLYLLWWVQEKQMSPAFVAATMAAGDLLLMALEVPTGWFADRVGYRRSLILGSVLQVAGMICCWLAEGIPGLVGACLLVAIADAFRSGADQSLLYRTCVALGREPEFQQIEARARAVQVAMKSVMQNAKCKKASQPGYELSSATCNTQNANTAGPNTNRNLELTTIAPRMRAICSASPRSS